MKRRVESSRVIQRLTCPSVISTTPPMQSFIRPCLGTARPLGRARAAIRHASTQYTTSSRNFRLTPTTAVLCFVPVLTGVLGVWQLQRLQWKVGLIREVDEAMAREPMVLPDEVK